jgi:hypothetical protein
MSAAYFGHEYISGSDLTKLDRMGTDHVEPDNIQQIYDAGTLNHQALLESYKADLWLKDQLAKANSFEEAEAAMAKYNLAKRMARTVLKDDLCRQVIMAPDFRREHEWYRKNCLGFHGTRCKTDGDSRKLSVIFEYKGLAVSTENAFMSAIDHHNYDRASCIYLDTTQLQRWLIACVSKKNPDRLFKRLVDRNHNIYLNGQAKIEKAKEKYRLLVGEVQ